CAPSREKYRPISSNSDWAKSPSAVWLVLLRTQFARGGVQHGVDELVAVGGAEALGETHGFVDHDAIRDIRRGLEFMRTHPQHRALDRVELGGFAIHEAGQRRIERLTTTADVGDQLVE